MDECYSCHISEEDEGLEECDGCNQMCCDTCIGEACPCADDNPWPDLYETPGE